MSFPDHEFTRTETIGDVARLIVAQLRTIGPCPKASAFYRLRRLLVQQLGVQRNSVRPSTPLASALPIAPKQFWALLNAEFPHVPPLVATPTIERWLLALGYFLIAPVMAVTYAATAAFEKLGCVVVLVFVFAIALARMFYVGVSTLVRIHPPAGVATVGDLARALAPPVEVSNLRDEQLHESVLQITREVFVEVLGWPLDRVRADTRWSEMD